MAINRYVELPDTNPGATHIPLDWNFIGEVAKYANVQQEKVAEKAGAVEALFSKIKTIPEVINTNPGGGYIAKTPDSKIKDELVKKYTEEMNSIVDDKSLDYTSKNIALSKFASKVANDKDLLKLDSRYKSYLETLKQIDSDAALSDSPWSVQSNLHNIKQVGEDFNYGSFSYVKSKKDRQLKDVEAEAFAGFTPNKYTSSSLPANVRSTLVNDGFVDVYGNKVAFVPGVEQTFEGYDLKDGKLQPQESLVNAASQMLQERAQTHYNKMNHESIVSGMTPAIINNKMVLIPNDKITEDERKQAIATIAQYNAKRETDIAIGKRINTQTKPVDQMIKITPKDGNGDGLANGKGFPMTERLNTSEQADRNTDIDNITKRTDNSVIVNNSNIRLQNIDQVLGENLNEVKKQNNINIGGILSGSNSKELSRVIELKEKGLNISDILTSMKTYTAPGVAIDRMKSDITKWVEQGKGEPIKTAYKDTANGRKYYKAGNVPVDDPNVKVEIIYPNNKVINEDEFIKQKSPFYYTLLKLQEVAPDLVSYTNENIIDVNKTYENVSSIVNASLKVLPEIVKDKVPNVSKALNPTVIAIPMSAISTENDKEVITEIIGAVKKEKGVDMSPETISVGTGGLLKIKDASGVEHLINAGTSNEIKKSYISKLSTKKTISPSSLKMTGLFVAYQEDIRAINLTRTSNINGKGHIRMSNGRKVDYTMKDGKMYVLANGVEQRINNIDELLINIGATYLER